MIQQAIDFRDESEALYRLLEPLKDEVFERVTQFKKWTINDVLTHLHLWNWAADLTLKDPAAFDEFLQELVTYVGRGTLREFENSRLKGLDKRKLLEEWHSFCHAMSDRYAVADPKARVKWAGPDMSARSKITARLMETWAHGQEVYDVLGVKRVDTDRIKNIAMLGIKTFGWTFSCRGLEMPGKAPYVKLTAPSGDTWEWNEPSEESRVEGSATEFCQVVTQVRNIADTQLSVTGDVATRWMSMAQCFAGPPEEPPAPGTRFTQSRHAHK
jgi:uncharacterized protein (TIGR03084 family)